MITLITVTRPWTGTHRVIVTGVLVAANPREPAPSRADGKHSSAAGGAPPKEELPRKEGAHVRLQTE